jgi:tight adherence protein B
MDSFLGGNSFLVLAVMVFIAILLLLEGSYLLWRTNKGPQAVRLRRRLGAFAMGRDRTMQARVLKQRLVGETEGLARMILGSPRLQVLDRFMLQSGLDWSLPGLILGALAAAAGGFFAVHELAHQAFVPSAAVGVAAGALPLLYVHWRRERRLARIGQQLPEALDLITRSLRAGHAFTSGLKMAGEELAEPIAGEFRAVHEEMNFGISMQQALTHLNERVPSTDLRYFVVAVLIQRDSGGNLTEILGDLSRLLRERAKLMAKVRVLSSEGRMSAWILGLMPFALAGIVNLANPKFMSLLWTDPIGIAMIKYLLAMMLVGALIMRKLVRIRV